MNRYQRLLCDLDLDLIASVFHKRTGIKPVRYKRDNTLQLACEQSTSRYIKIILYRHIQKQRATYLSDIRETIHKVGDWHPLISLLMDWQCQLVVSQGTWQIEGRQGSLVLDNKLTFRLSRISQAKLQSHSKGSNSIKWKAKLMNNVKTTKIYCIIQYV
jgi:hypothetical protein